ncbi:hypothetical protein C8F04DRAFT_1269815 [Mycena alexandri]|uniref:Ribonuclease H1 N-terminal domain-containing protein n=1 Tax=Mycena alexandri TaxID=1745969 RepID=A0AAD6WVJ8_9AGAR|nr:hypothetical protein C8F04DRAFT_1269815 [Mycena alexandri]
MATRDAPPNYDNELIDLIANLDLSTVNPAPPRTPPPVAPAAPSQRHTFPSVAPHRHPVLYEYHSPTRGGFTAEWSSAGFATQGVPNARVQAVRQPNAKKKKVSKSKKAAYVVFCGLQCGVFETWNETHALVNGVANSIFRGYPTLAEAQAAFAYATIRGWTRVAGRPVVSGIAQLPQPINIQNTRNALNSDAEFNGTWYVVYRGITPGVYRSHLESQLNTVGVRGALHESIVGLSAAIEKYRNATSRGESASAAPPQYHDVFS